MQLSVGHDRDGDDTDHHRQSEKQIQSRWPKQRVFVITQGQEDPGGQDKGRDGTCPVICSSVVTRQTDTHDLPEMPPVKSRISENASPDVKPMTFNIKTKAVVPVNSAMVKVT